MLGILKKAVSLTLCAAVVLTSSALPENISDKIGSAVDIITEAADTVVYNGDTMSTFSSRTPDSVAKKYSDAYYAGATYKNRDSSSYYTTPASTESPYNQGVLTDDTLLCMQEMTDFYRWLVGVSPLNTACTQNDSLQCQALDRNFEFNHYISNDSKPDDMPDELWEKGYACAHNILAWGYTPLGAITGWMNEGYSLRNGSWDTLGHRYALINPTHTNVQFGFSGSIAVGVYKYDSSGSFKEPFYAFPSPGYMPSDCIEPEYSSWSADFDTKKIKITDTSAVKVTVTNLSTNESYECTKANGKLSVSSSSVNFVQPSDYDTSSYTYKSNYKVVITGLTDTATSKAAQVQYTVKFFDLKEYAVGKITNAGFDFSNIIFMNGAYTDTESLKKLGALLPKTVTLTNEFGNTVQVKAKGRWTLDEKNKCWYNSVDPSVVPEKFTDNDGLLKKMKITYQSSDDNFDTYNSLSVSKSKVNCGDDVKFSIWRTHTNCECTLLAQIAKDSNGNYYTKKSYSSLTSPEFDKEGSGTYHYYNIKAKGSDSGEYISIYYSKSSYWKNAYACNNIRELTVSHNYEETGSKQPTCTADGSTTYTCSGCGNSYSDTIPALGHSWGKVSYTWTKTSAGYTCTALRTCANDSTHKQTETVEASYEVTKQPTCEAKGVGTYSVSFTNKAFSAQTKKIDIAATGHSWGKVSYTWTKTSTGYTCTATRTCGNDTTHKQTEKVTASYKVTTAATCEAKGVGVYTASFSNSAFKTQTKKIDIAATGHSWGKVSYTWTKTSAGYTCTALRTCANDSNHKQTEKVTASYKVTTPATCEAKGVGVYTASFSNTAFSTQTKKIDIAATGHSWGKVSYTWTKTSTGYTCTATRTCANDTTHKQTEKVTAAYEVTTAPTTTSTGIGTYTATFSNSAFKTQTRTIVLPKEKYIWGDPTYSWTKTSAGYTCTATRIATNDTTQKQAETGTVSYKVSKEATCTATGTGVYTASFKNSAFSTQTKKVTIAKAAHTYGAWEIKGFDVASSCSVQTRVCTQCGAKSTKTVVGDVQRLSGSGRYATASAISQNTFADKCDTVVLANARSFADALAGGTLAKVYNAPILLTEKDSLPAQTLEEIKRLGASKVLILGGSGSVGQNVKDTLTGNGLDIEIIKGSTRYATAVEIAKAVKAETRKDPTEVFFVSAENFADALSVSAIAAAKKAIILFLPKTGEIDAATAAHLKTLKGKIKNAFVIGGSGVISNDVMQAAGDALGLTVGSTIERVRGATKYDTCVEVNKKFSGVLTTKAICIATGEDFPDALAGGVFAANKKTPLFLAGSSLTDSQKSYLKTIKADKIYILGGKGSVPDAVVQDIADEMF